MKNIVQCFDLGGSTVDYLMLEDGEISIEDSFEASSFKISDMILESTDEVRVTGGKSSMLPDEIRGIPVIKFSEIEAIGRGGVYLAGANGESIVVSMGTGTCIVHAHDDVFAHLGGTGVGGGTLLGLSSGLLGVKSLAALFELYEKGDHNNVDILVREIAGKGIGRIPAFWTASNLGKLSDDSEKDRNDLAAGIVYLVGQTIGMMSVFAAKRFEISDIVLIGKLSRFTSLMSVFNVIGEVYGVNFIIPDKASRGTVYGLISCGNSKRYFLPMNV